MIQQRQDEDEDEDIENWSEHTWRWRWTWTWWRWRWRWRHQDLIRTYLEVRGDRGVLAAYQPVEPLNIFPDKNNNKYYCQMWIMKKKYQPAEPPTIKSSTPSNMKKQTQLIKGDIMLLTTQPTLRISRNEEYLNMGIKNYCKHKHFIHSVHLDV